MTTGSASISKDSLPISPTAKAIQGRRDRALTMTILAIDLEWGRRRNDLYRCTSIGVAVVNDDGVEPIFLATASELRREHYEQFLEIFDAPFSWLGHNVAGDARRFAKDLAALDLPAPLIVEHLDTLAMARQTWRRSDNSLLAAVRRAGVARQWRSHAHTAMADAVMCGELYVHLESLRRHA